MLVKNGEETKKSSAPRCCTPESGRGSIKTPHGTELIRYSKPQDIKNARSKYGEPSRLIQMYSIAKLQICTIKTTIYTENVSKLLFCSVKK